LDRGIDGFRIDVMGMVLKHPQLLDNPVNPDYRPGMAEYSRLLSTNSLNYPDVYSAVAGIRSVLDEYPGSVTVGEVFGSPDVLAGYYGTEAAPGLHLNFNFQLIGRDLELLPWDAAQIGAIVREYDDLPNRAEPCYVLGNHDRPRFISRHDADGLGAIRARAACLLLLSLRATPFIYYGEEIGMRDVAVPEERLRDPARHHHPGRDPERTPMQWTSEPGRGFTTGEPWLPFGPQGINVEAQQGDPASLLSLYRRAIRLRRAEPALHSGGFRVVAIDDELFIFQRDVAGGRTIISALNTSTEHRETALPAGSWSILLGTTETAVVADGRRLYLPGLAAAWVVEQ